MQPDSLIQNVYDSQGLNRYSFERNNPYNKIDTTGHFFIADDAAELLFIVLAAYYIGTLTMMVSSVMLEEAKEIGYKDDIKRATINFYVNAITSPLDVLSPGEKLVQVYGYYSTASTINEALGLISKQHIEFMQRIRQRNDIIQNAIGQSEHNSNQQVSSGIKNPAGSNPFGMGNLIQRWLIQNPDKKDDLNKAAGGGSKGSGSSGGGSGHGTIHLNPGESSGTATCYVACTITW